MPQAVYDESQRQGRKQNDDSLLPGILEKKGGQKAETQQGKQITQTITGFYNL